MEQAKDLNGNTIQIGMEVEMPEPKSDKSETWLLGGWVMYVEDILSDGNILGTDSEGDFHQVEGNRVEIYEEKKLSPEEEERLKKLV